MNVMDHPVQNNLNKVVIKKRTDQAFTSLDLLVTGLHLTRLDNVLHDRDVGHGVRRALEDAGLLDSLVLSLQFLSLQLKLSLQLLPLNDLLLLPHVVAAPEMCWLVSDYY